MFNGAVVTTKQKVPLSDFLLDKGFQLEQADENVVKIQREGELPVFAHINDNILFFEVDLGNISEFSSTELYFKMFDLNTEILPVSLGIDSTNKNDPRLVLVESREVDNLDDNEVLSVLNAMELATDKVEELLSNYIK
ncbi:MAG: hypothetical protein GF344_04330 [Chitinivibrionales bacterium]|nr:hypothetical protein [Chitinivibrionales bacterium]MBD3356270.1 hypothetical protein [Chitinivibrionales bacterium]